MRASKRMAAICQSQLCPAEFVEHCDSLTSLGFQRMTGLTQRPKLRCPEYVHHQLFKIVQAFGNCSVIKCRSTSVKLLHAPPKIFSSQTRTRLNGKQPAPLGYQKQPERRVVKSHKASTAHVQWNAEEQSVLQTTANWRDRQRLEKILLHNRDAESIGKHVVVHERVDGKFVCQKCPKTSDNLSRLLADSCGGDFDQEQALPGRQRVSVKLAQRVKIAQEHNATRTVQHELVLPTDVNEIPCCNLCGRRQQWEGWKRIRKFLRETCSHTR